MQFSFVAVFVAALAASASASAINVAKRGDCDVGACLTSNEAILTKCIPAVTGGFTDVFADIACITGLVGAFKDPSAECQVCFEEVKGIFEGIGQKKL